MDYNMIDYQSCNNDEIVHKLSSNALTILSNEKIEDKLNVIVIHTNPCHFKRRKFLSEQFKSQMLKTPDVELFIVELVYDLDSFEITDANNKNHLQLRTSKSNMLWSKENLINIATEKLLPQNYKAFAWIDADIEFDNIHWAEYKLKLLNGHYDVMQLFDICLDLNKNNETKL